MEHKENLSQSEENLSKGVTDQSNQNPSDDERFLEELHQNLLSKEVLKASELLQYKGKEIPYLWEGIIPKNGICFLTGASDCNKSTFLRQLAIAVGRGDKTFLGIPLNAKKKKSILVITEDLSINIAALFNKQNLKNEDLKNVTLLFPQSDVIAKLNSLLASESVDLVVLDTWTDIYGGNLNQANEVRHNLKVLNSLCSKYDCAILALHHERKGTEDGSPKKDSMLGSMGIQAYSRVVLQMKKDSGNRRLLTIVKGNYVPESMKNASFVLELDEETMILSGTSEVIGANSYNNRTYSLEKKEKYMADVKAFLEQEYSQEKIVTLLQEKYPDENTPAKGTINKWLKEDSQSVDH